MKTTPPARDGRGTPIPPIIDQLQGTDLLKAGAEWYSASRLPDIPSLTPTEVAILWIVGPMDLTQADAAGLLNLSYQRVSFLWTRAVRKLREAKPLLDREAKERQEVGRAKGGQIAGRGRSRSDSIPQKVVGSKPKRSGEAVPE